LALAVSETYMGYSRYICISVKRSVFSRLFAILESFTQLFCFYPTWRRPQRPPLQPAILGSAVKFRVSDGFETLEACNTRILFAGAGCYTLPGIHVAVLVRGELAKSRRASLPPTACSRPRCWAPVPCSLPPSLPLLAAWYSVPLNYIISLYILCYKIIYIYIYIYYIILGYLILNASYLRISELVNQNLQACILEHWRGVL